MSWSCCCCMSPSGELLLDGNASTHTGQRSPCVPHPAGSRKEEEEEEEEEESRGRMELSLLRQQYRSTTDTQRRHTQVLLFRTVSDELSQAVCIIPVTQGLTSPWEPNSCSPPAVTSDPDPWHVHLGLHRRSRPGAVAQLAASSPETTNTNSSSRRSSSSLETCTLQQDVDPALGPHSSSRETSPCSSSNSTTEEEHSDTDGSRGAPGPGPLEGTRGDSDGIDPVQDSGSGPADASEHQSLSDGSTEGRRGSDGGSAPRGSTASLHRDLRENQSTGRRTTNGVLPTAATSAWRGSGRLAAPALRFTRQLSVGGVGSSSGGHHDLNYHPFPNRKPPRISEAARRLGMYSSF
ncbi:uncharacterized protein [Pempheris klunzingeri]|uniref:uncharacterized protein n=1 Tax=Pempheris klunzingeri TaxID=3127111 RepID=UPI0039814924